MTDEKADISLIDALLGHFLDKGKEIEKLLYENIKDLKKRLEIQQCINKYAELNAKIAREVALKRIDEE